VRRNPWQWTLPRAGSCEMSLKNEALHLLDKLIGCWNDWEHQAEWYVSVLAAGIASFDPALSLTGEEKAITTQLHELLTEDEWSRLPELLRQRRAGKLQRLESDCRRDEAAEAARLREEERLSQQKEQEELERRKAEQERQRREQERRRAEEAVKARKRALIDRINHQFISDFLCAAQGLAADPDAELMSPGEFDELRVRFVQDWATRELHASIDHEQAAAVAAHGGDVLVEARAGSGKTRTLVTRAIFLQKHCGVLPGELLLLAFNKNAADEMKGRLAANLGEDLPHAMTFHALAHALVHPKEEIVFDDLSADQLGLSREIQEVIDEHVRSRECAPRIRTLMLTHFREDWERIVAGRFELAMDEFLEYRRALTRESLRGDYVKSYGERVIANALFEHGVDYRYERNFRWSGVNYRPDFTIPTKPGTGVIIEYFGLSGDADYDEMSERKRQFWGRQVGWTFIEFSPIDLASNGEASFIEHLLARLAAAGITWQRRSEEELWELIRARAVDKFTEAMRTFIGRCRKRNLTHTELEGMIANHTPCLTAEALFLDLGLSIYRGYRERLLAIEKQDFDGLLWSAISLVREGRTRFVRDKGRERGDISKLKFVLVDEFQDFAPMFFELLSAMRMANPGIEFFCVGDNWQAINSFAGSELSYFDGFETHFNDTARRVISTNYRSARSVVEIGNALMYGRGRVAEAYRADAGYARLCDLSVFSPSPSEIARHNGDEVTPALLRLIRWLFDFGWDIALLSRRNGIPWYVNFSQPAAGSANSLGRYLEHLRSFLPEEDRRRIGISTVHRYKGLEQSAVIVLDAIGQSYPLIHPNWLFLRVFGDTIERIVDEERRLFYVAITRAREALALLTEPTTESPFLNEIDRWCQLPVLSWEELPPLPSLEGPRLEIRVFHAYEVRDELKKLSYRWNAGGKYWHKAVMEDSFSSDALVKQPWVNETVGIEVHNDADELVFKR